MSTQPDAVDPDPSETPNVLVLESRVDAGPDDPCTDLLRSGPGVGTHAIHVAFADPPERVLARRRDRIDREPARTTVVDVETMTRGATAETTGGAGPTDASIERVSDPADLVTLGVTLSDLLERSRLEGYEPRVCFRSLTAAIQHADEGVVFKFLHVLTSAVERRDAVAHYHMDVDAHDRSTVETLARLFDAVVETGERDSDDWGG